MIHLGLPIFLLLAASGPAGAASAGRFEFREASLAGTPHRYAVWLPPGFGAGSKMGVVLFLHGSGECGEDGIAPTRIGIGPALTAHPERWPFVVVFPQKPTDMDEWEEREDLVLGTLAAAAREFGCDTTRVALAGISQGGHGAWLIGARHPERFRCVVPVCGYGHARTISRRIARLPVWAFQGMKDDIVAPEDTRRIVEGIRAERARLGLDTLSTRATFYPDANHDSWDPAFAEPELPRWIATQLGATR